jgi:hypothetical protein
MGHDLHRETHRVATPIAVPTARPRVRRPLAAWTAILATFATTTLVGCFIEIARPAQFRYTCEVDEDCPSGESCIGALCQVPCSTATAADACPSEAGYVACFNGGCASLCTVGDDVCPSPQTCIGLGGGTDGGEGDEASTTGLCGAPCSADDPSSCPDGESCVMGACVLTCVDTDPEPCPDGLVCTFGVCITDELPFAGTLPSDPPHSAVLEAQR